MIEAPPAHVGDRAPSVLAGEARKLTAFLRRDFLVAWSYRAAFVSDILGLLTQTFVFAIVGLMVDESVLPSYGGSPTTYIEFVSIGMALGVFVSICLARVTTALRGEQIQGTLEALMMTPTSLATIQVGSVMYDLVYVPVRTAIFLLVVALVFEADFVSSGIPPATVLVLGLIPVVWGVGIASAGLTLTFRRGLGLVTLGGTLLTISSGAYFPLTLLPGWVSDLAALNPLAIVINGMRDALLGGTGWQGLGGDLVVLAPMALVSLLAGSLVFRAAVRREQRLGTLGLY